MKNMHNPKRKFFQLFQIFLIEQENNLGKNTDLMDKRTQPGLIVILKEKSWIKENFLMTRNAHSIWYHMLRIVSYYLLPD